MQTQLHSLLDSAFEQQSICRVRDAEAGSINFVSWSASSIGKELLTASLSESIEHQNQGGRYRISCGDLCRSPSPHPPHRSEPRYHLPKPWSPRIPRHSRTQAPAGRKQAANFNASGETRRSRTLAHEAATRDVTIFCLDYMETWGLALSCWNTTPLRLANSSRFSSMLQSIQLVTVYIGIYRSVMQEVFVIHLSNPTKCIAWLFSGEDRLSQWLMVYFVFPMTSFAAHCYRGPTSDHPWLAVLKMDHFHSASGVNCLLICDPLGSSPSSRVAPRRHNDIRIPGPLNVSQRSCEICELSLRCAVLFAVDYF